MTANFQTQFENTIGNNTSRFYQVDIEDFDNEIESFEIEATSIADAAEKAEWLASGDILNMIIKEIIQF